MKEKKEDIPKEYKDFNNQVFNKAVFEKLLDWLKWDYAIKLIPNTTLKDCKVYSLNVKEQEELNKFLEEHLKSEWIWSSKLLYAVIPQANFPWKITFNKLYNNRFLIGIRSRILSISLECNTIW